jgi:GT2 family glycosyltransferase
MSELEKSAPDAREHSRPETVSFIVPAWNEERHLAACLASIANLELPAGVAIETVVVDNQSTDKTAGVAKEFGVCVCTVAPGRASRARNVGAARACGDWLAFVDADCELPPDWLTKCHGHLQSTDVVAAGAAMRSPARDASWVERSWHALASARTPQSATLVRWLPTFNLLVRRLAFDDVGGFDEHLVTCEDCDLGYRLATRGRLIFDPSTTVAHHGESQTLAQLFRREAWRSQGNLRLALQQVRDWRNWISLLLPPASLAGLVCAIVLSLAALRVNATLWPYIGACLALFALPFGLVLARVVSRAPTPMLPRILVVFGAYLAARTAGLFLSVPRVGREGV